ncbi:MAG: mechanosensitive ion channel [Cyanobacteria bacterium P01_E01_bin.6]
MNELLMTTLVTGDSPHVPPLLGSPLLGQSNVPASVGGAGEFVNSLWSSFGEFLPSLIYAIVILIVGWIVATIAASIVKGLLGKTDIDNRLARWVTGQQADAPSPPIEKWVAAVVYWLIMTFTLVAFLQALQLDVVSEPLNNFLQQIFNYLPRIGGALVLLGVAWVVATIVKLIFTNLLSRFNLDDKLAGATGDSDEGSPFLVNETIGNALYWFILLFFLPLVLDVLELQGPLEPVQNLLDDILSALPKILTATIIGVVGWFVARVVRGIVTSLLAAAGADQLGERFGLSRSTPGTALSGIIGTVVYVLVLIPTAIAALNALQIEAISEPAVEMLELILTVIPRIFAAGVIVGVFYFIGQFVSELVSSLLTSVGFNNIFRWLGLPQIQNTIPTEPTPAVTDEPTPYVRPTSDNQLALQARTPSQIVGLAVLVAIVLVGAVAATEVLQFAQLTNIVQAVLRISLRVLSGVVVFGIGLYFANLAFSLITSSASKQARILGQTARIAIIALVAAMALQQMGIATDIVNLAFGLLLGSIAVAIAIAFGLGGRDIASEQIREWLNSFKN